MGQEVELAEALEAVATAYFDADGMACDYDALAASRERGRLAGCLLALDELDPRKLTIPAQTAFWLNLYNALVLRDVLEMVLEDFFERERVRIAGHTWSLDDIEHGLLRGNAPKYGRLRAPMRKGDPRLSFMPPAYDERMHFAMYTACRSSPALRAFHGEKLDAELEEATRRYLHANVRVKEEGARIRLPRVLQWYAADFGGERGVLEFVLARLDDETVDMVDRRQGRVKLKYNDFDWSLNQKSGSEPHGTTLANPR